MLEIQILKVTHAEQDQAKKLFPYIQEADIYAPESAALSEERAQHLENEWQNIITSDISEAQFIHRMERELSYIPPDVKTYRITERLYLFRKKSPLWHLERFSNAASLLETKQLEEKLCNDALDALSMGNRDDFLDLYKRSLGVEAKLTELRDREMGRNLKEAEDRIRLRYPHVNAKSTIKFLIAIGASHKPEQYTQQALTILNLKKEPISIGERLDEAVNRGDTLDSIHPLMLEYGVAELTRRQRLLQTLESAFEEEEARLRLRGS